MESISNIFVVCFLHESNAAPVAGPGDFVVDVVDATRGDWFAGRPADLDAGRNAESAGRRRRRGHHDVDGAGRQPRHRRRRRRRHRRRRSPQVDPFQLNWDFWIRFFMNCSCRNLDDGMNLIWNGLKWFLREHLRDQESLIESWYEDSHRVVEMQDWIMDANVAEMNSDRAPVCRLSCLTRSRWPAAGPTTASTTTRTTNWNTSARSSTTWASCLLSPQS